MVVRCCPLLQKIDRLQLGIRRRCEIVQVRFVSSQELQSLDIIRALIDRGPQLFRQRKIFCIRIDWRMLGPDQASASDWLGRFARDSAASANR